MVITHSLVFELEYEDQPGSYDYVEVSLEGTIEEDCHCMDGFKESYPSCSNVYYEKSTLSDQQIIAFENYIKVPKNLQLLELEILKSYEQWSKLNYS